MNGPFWASVTWWSYAFVWLPFALCTATYAARSPWRSLPIGRALMTLLGSLTAVLSFVLIRLAVPLPTETVDALRVVTLGAVGIAGWALWRQIVVLQRRHKPHKPHPKRRATDVP